MTHKKEEKFLIGGKIMLIGSHVGMKGKDMFLGSVKEALSYGLPCKIRKFLTYGSDYDNNPLVTYI